MAYANHNFMILLLLAYVNNENHFLLPVLLSTNIASMYKEKYALYTDAIQTGTNKKQTVRL